VSEEVNRKCALLDGTTFNPYTDPKRHNTRRHRQTERQDVGSQHAILTKRFQLSVTFLYITYVFKLYIRRFSYFISISACNTCAIVTCFY